jgi:ABC-type sulfate/molybdate transport systems ATPase subunit
MARLDLDFALGLRAFILDVALSAEAETVALVGPSGAGKTSVLAVIAGLRRPDRGRVVADDVAWVDRAAGVDLPPERRRVGLVPQDYGLFPHMTVEQNVEFAGGGRTDELLARLRIAHLAGERPGQLSGGERQRVALARALARDPAVLLLDEPLAALDAHTRLLVRDELGEILSQLGIPTLLVTHDFADATNLADRVAVIDQGHIRQVGTPAQLLAEPADGFVITFTGGNLLDGTRTGATSSSTTAPGSAPRPRRRAASASGSTRGTCAPRRSPRPTGVNAVPGVVVKHASQGGRTRLRIGRLVVECSDADAAVLDGAGTAFATFPPCRGPVVRKRGQTPDSHVATEGTGPWFAQCD